MVFKPPKWVPNLDLDSIPASIPVSHFMLDEKYGRSKLDGCKPLFVCGLSGTQYTALEIQKRVDFLARGLAKDFGWSPNKGSEWDKVITIFAHNTLDSIPLSWAIHNLSGISSPANSTYNTSELTYQLESSGSKAIFTCFPLLGKALKAAANCGIPRKHIYILAMPFDKQLGNTPPKDLKTVDQLISEGSKLPSLEPLVWEKGRGKRQCAFLNYSSEISGLPKAVMISHTNVIANVLQLCAFESAHRNPGQTNVVLGLLPQSHIYSFFAMCHAIYRGDSVVVLPKFDISALASAIQTFRVNVLFVVPPILTSIIDSKPLLDKFDFRSVTEVFSCGAPLGAETQRTLQEQYPNWYIRNSYAMTETVTTISATSTRDIFPGSVGSLVPGVEARLISLTDGADITECGQAGELLVRSPSVTDLGYSNDDKSTWDTFGRAADGDGWLRTGDVAMFLSNPKGEGYEHLFIVDSTKDLIKVKDHQVSPAELEVCLLNHPLIADVAVIAVPDKATGEIPKAFVVLAPHDRGQFFPTLEEITEEIYEYVRDQKSHYKWLVGGIEFVDVIPRSLSGRIPRRRLQDKERMKGRELVAKL